MPSTGVRHPEVRSAAKRSEAKPRRTLEAGAAGLHDRRMNDELGLPPGAFARIDEEDDEAFYEPARLVLHIDDHAVAMLTGLYHEILPAGGVLLDLMSSWVSHLPKDIDYGEVIGHGMNLEELAANPRL